MEIDHKKIAEGIAKELMEGGMIKDVVTSVLPPILDEHKKEIIKSNRRELYDLAKQNGLDCEDWSNNQKDLAHLRNDRLSADSNVRKIKEMGFFGSIIAIIAYLGLDKLF